MSRNSEAKRGENNIVKFYLLTYNFLQILGWCIILHKSVNFLLQNDSSRDSSLWTVIKLPVVIFQNAATLEIFHSLFGLVKSNPIVTTFQVASRVIVVCCVLLATPSNYAAASIGLPLVAIAWSITEIIRYSYYFTNLIGYVPYVLTWLRYSTFIILYPIGITGELVCFYAATKYAKLNESAWSYTLPNIWNFTFSYYYFLVAIMLLYIPLFPQLFGHMYSQRCKVLRVENSSNVPSHKKVS